MLFSLRAAILANNDSSVTITETVFGGSHEDLGVQSQQSRIESTLSPSQFNSSKLRTVRRRHLTTPADHLLVRLTDRVLLVYNNTDRLDLLHSFKLSSPNINCDPTGLEEAPGVYSSSRGRFPAIALVECSSRVYGLFSMADGGFRPERRALYLPLSAEKTIIPRQDGSVYVFIEGGDVLSGGLGATDWQAHMLFHLVDISPSCSEFARLHDQPYDSNRFVLRCANNQSFLCSLQGSCTQVHIQSTGEHELDIAFSRDIAVATSSESATVYRDSFTQSCSLNVSTLKSYLIMTPDNVLLVLFTPGQISTYNITSGCEPNPITSLNINCHSAGCGAPEIFNRYVVLTSSSNTVYDATIIDTHSGEILYTTYTQLPLAYQLNVRKSMNPPTVPPLPSPSPTHTTKLQSPSADVTHFESSQSVLPAMPVSSSPTVPSQSPSAVDNATQVHLTTPFVTTTSSSLFVELTATYTPPVNTNQSIIAVVAPVAILLPAVVIVSAGMIIFVYMFVQKRRKDLDRQPTTAAGMELEEQNDHPTRQLEAETHPIEETDQDRLGYGVPATQESRNGSTMYINTQSWEPSRDQTTDLSTQPTTCPPLSPRSHESSAFRY